MEPGPGWDLMGPGVLFFDWGPANPLRVGKMRVRIPAVPVPVGFTHTLFGLCNVN